MMNYRIRLFLDTIIDTVNQFSDIPLEARRLVLESAMHIVEREADKAIIEERPPQDVDIVVGGNEDGITENILQN